ncbi:hypothetical protein PRUPE_5G146000 [Prunus persica]|uniref:Uncharacterized protein n=1 Tax=Prunus persica TaxID=3760 RepID=A0A251P8I4_PRUPE|nr:uncharacterized protein LOC18777480 isoform X2 [Prunus persica]ONI07898.1 hypothetical protein PRUPE_5G146000 [Prunus persica]
MGGQNSKLTPEGEAVPPRIRSLLQRKFEEIRGRTKAKKLKASHTFSKKQLLKDGEQEEVDISVPHSLQSSPEFENLPSPKTPQTLELLPRLPELDRRAKQSDEDQIRRDGAEFSVEDDKEAKGVNVYIGGVFAMGETTEGEEEEEDEVNDAGMQRNSKIHLCPASPSFRVYCMEPLEIENDDSKDDITDEDFKHKKSPSAESADSSVDSVQDTKTKQKGRRRRRIKNALRPNTVKNLLNVKGCYYAGCTGGHDRTTYVAAKKSAAT